MRIEIIFAIVYGLFLLCVCIVSLCIYLHKKKLTLGEFIIKVNESLDRTKFSAEEDTKPIKGTEYISYNTKEDVIKLTKYCIMLADKTKELNDEVQELKKQLQSLTKL